MSEFKSQINNPKSNWAQDDDSDSEDEFVKVTKEEELNSDDESDDSSMDAAGRDDIEGQDGGVEGLSVRYLKREAYFSKRDIVAKRLNTSSPHEPCAGPDRKPESCVWFCHSKHSHLDPKRNRHG